MTKSFLEESGIPNADIETLLGFDIGKLHLVKFAIFAVA